MLLASLSNGSFRHLKIAWASHGCLTRLLDVGQGRASMRCHLSVDLDRNKGGFMRAFCAAFECALPSSGAPLLRLPGTGRGGGADVLYAKLPEGVAGYGGHPRIGNAVIKGEIIGHGCQHQLLALCEVVKGPQHLKIEICIQTCACGIHGPQTHPEQVRLQRQFT